MRRFDPAASILIFGLAFTALVARAEPTAAQGADRNRMTRGDSVRIRLASRMTVAASFNRWQADGILLDVEGFAQPYSIALADMQRLDAFMLRTNRESFRHGAVFGGASGLFIGAGVGLILHTTGVIADADGLPSEIVTDAFRWMGFGVVAGTVLGAFYAGSHPGLGWIQISLPAS